MRVSACRGPSGVGKTHLAIAIGYEAVRAGIKVRFKNDGHYFCGAGGNRPDGSDEALTYNIKALFFIMIFSAPIHII